jgi:hypothetical protein
MIATLNKLFIWTRKIHRIFLFATTFLVLVMGFTGIFLKYTSFSAQLHINLSLMRYIHNQISPFFAVALGAMMLTGLYMYIYPPLIHFLTKK